MTKPTLHDVTLFLDGAADAETRARVEQALCDPCSEASRFVAFARKARRNPLRWPILNLTRVWPWEQEAFPRQDIRKAEGQVRDAMAKIRLRLADQGVDDWGEYYNATDLSEAKLPPEHPLHQELNELYEELLANGPGLMPPGRPQSYASEARSSEGALGRVSDEDDDEYEAV